MNRLKVSYINLKILLKNESLINSISQFLRTNGYDSDTNVGSSGFKLDIGVIDPSKKGHYLCAIKIDGKRYSKASTTMDRHRLTPNLLKVRGWKKIFHENGKDKITGVAIPTSDKIDFKMKPIKRDKKDTI